jgi:hypothetical protein
MTIKNDCIFQNESTLKYLNKNEVINVWGGSYANYPIS